jgi:hypothetical protein
MCWPIGCPSPQIQHMTTTILKSSILSRDISASKNQFHNGINSQGISWIDAWGPKSLKIQAREGKIESFVRKDDIRIYLCSEGTAEARLIVWRISSEASWVVLLARLCKVKQCSPEWHVNYLERNEEQVHSLKWEIFHFLVQLLVAIDIDIQTYRHFKTDSNSGLDPTLECAIFPTAKRNNFNVDSEAVMFFYIFFGGLWE